MLNVLVADLFTLSDAVVTVNGTISASDVIYTVATPAAAPP